MAVNEILGCVLAGGRSRRMGRDKTFVELAGRPLVAHAIDRLAAQTGRLAVSFNGDPKALASYRIAVLADRVPGSQGPLAGLHAAFQHARNLGDTSHVATVAADSPFFPDSLVSDLAGAAAPLHGIALAASGGRVHPVFGVFPVALAEDLQDWLASDESRSMRAWIDRHASTVVEYPFETAGDPFFNINTEADLDIARQRLNDRS